MWKHKLNNVFLSATVCTAETVVMCCTSFLFWQALTTVFLKETLLLSDNYQRLTRRKPLLIFAHDILCCHQSTTVYAVDTVGSGPLLPTVVYVGPLLIPAQDYFYGN